MSDNNQTNQYNPSSNQQSNNSSDNNSELLSLLNEPGVQPYVVHVNTSNYSAGDTSGYSTHDENNNNTDGK